MSDEIDVEETPGYVAPKKVDLETLKNLDQDDEALQRWKAALLEGADGADSDDPRRVIVTAMRLVPQDHDALVMDLTGDLSAGQNFVIKEGSVFHIEIDFKVQHDVVAGLRYADAIYRKGIRVDKNSHMLGSYGPKTEVQTARTPVQECPKGMLARGHYTVKSAFIDDDKEKHLEWKWSFDVKKAWAS